VANLLINYLKSLWLAVFIRVPDLASVASVSPCAQGADLYLKARPAQPAYEDPGYVNYLGYGLALGAGIGIGAAIWSGHHGNINVVIAPPAPASP
jgi:hypothetical protein